MGFISWILLGLFAGAIAKFLMPGRDPGGIFVTILIGVVGAILGGWVGSLFGFGKVEAFDLWGLMVSVAGALLLLLVFRLVRGRSNS